MLSKYGVARHVFVVVVKRSASDYAVGADWTPAAGDVKISKDGGAAANVTNLPTAIAMGNTAIWDFSLTATEMQAAIVVVTVADAATKVVEDQAFIIETYGNASAQHEFDLDTPTVVASSVSALAANVITAASINADAITAAKVADGTIDAATFAAGAINAAAIAADAITAAKIADGAIDAATFAAGAINAAAIAADAIGASELAADAVAEIQSGLATATALTTAQADLDDIQTRLPAALVGGRIDASVGAMAADVVTASAIATDAIGSAELAASAVTEIQSGLATAANLATVAGYIDTEVADIQSRLPAALVGGRMDSSTGAMAAGVVTSAAVATGAIDADALASDAVAEIADGVWDEAIAGHLTAGSTGESLSTAGATGPTAAVIADAVWDEARAGHVAGGSFGEGVASVQGNVTGSAASVVGAVGSVAAGGITAASVATDAIDGDAIAASAVAEIQSGLATSAGVAAVQADTDDIQTRLPAALVGGRMDASVGAMGANVMTAAAAAPDLATELQAGLATSASVAAVQADTDDLQTSMTTALAGLSAINADTDNLQSRLPAALVGGRIDASVGAMAANTLTASALATDAVTEIASAIGARIVAEPAGMFTWAGASYDAIMATLATLIRNEISADSNSVDVRNDADTATLWTYPTADDGVTFTSGEAT